MRQKSSFNLAVILFLIFLSFPAFPEEDTFQHFAFANYLGSGVYHASGQNTTVFNVPISFDLKKDKTKSLQLKTPISLGFFNFKLGDLPESGLPERIGTMTLIPGVMYEHKKTEQHTYQAYFDLGYGKNFSSGNEVAIMSVGVSSIVDLNKQPYDPLWISRFYYAGYHSVNGQSNDSFSAFQSGIDVGLKTHWYSDLLKVNIQPRFFTVGYLYFNKLEFVTPLDNQALIGDSIEFGASLAFSKPILWEWMSINRIGISYRVGEDVAAWRLMFDLPI